MFNGSSKSGNRSLSMSLFMPSNKGDGGAMGRRRFEYGLLMRSGGLGRMVVDVVADAKSVSELHCRA